MKNDLNSLYTYRVMQINNEGVRKNDINQDTWAFQNK